MAENDVEGRSDDVDETLAQVAALMETLGQLTPRNFAAVQGLIDSFANPVEAEINPASDVATEEFAEVFGDVLRRHHTTSSEAFTKDKFEYAMVQTLVELGHSAEKAPAGNPGRDLVVDGAGWSLKTQADKNIRIDVIHISKFMELGKGRWEVEADLIGLRDRMMEHMTRYDRIFTLRRIVRPTASDNAVAYELVEIPKALLERANEFPCVMAMGSKQVPKPGTCIVREGGRTLFELYFDGGTERKLQVRKLAKSECFVHATWRFNQLRT
jgi:hypothetical protein